MLVHQTKRMHNRRELIIGELTKLSRQQRRQLLLGTPRPAAPPRRPTALTHSSGGEAADLPYPLPPRSYPPSSQRSL